MTMTRKRASTGVVRGLHLLICSPLHHTPSLPSTALAIVTVMVKLMLALMILTTAAMTFPVDVTYLRSCYSYIHPMIS